MHSLIVRHLTGSRAAQVDVIDLAAHTELIFGRAPSAAVRFDPHTDRVVGRYHAKLLPVHGDEWHFTLADLHSRNGTFVNGVRVGQPVQIRSGDTVQLGRDGPTMVVSVASEPAAL
jgi:pSer/pThr/pTyr-binding forkhead associated (FHA) protein